MDNSTKYESNSEIEDLLSETASNGGMGSPSMKIKKVGGERHNSNNVNDRMEVSSNKDVDVGLELLINREKKNHGEPTGNRSHSGRGASDINSGFNINKKNEGDLVNDMLSNLDLDATSHLSQQDIDKLIDEADQNSILEQKSVIEESSPDINNNTDTLSVLESRRSLKMPSMSSEETRRKKQEILFKLEKMRRLGVAGIKKFNMSNKLSSMQDELDRVKYERELESSIKFQRKCLMAMVTGTELLNNKFDFLDLKLDGWSEQVHDNIDEYNEVFEELHEKYRTKMKMSPEIKLVMMLGGGAFMYHLTNSMFKNSIPGMEDIMKQNPDLMKQFASAAINQMQGEERQAAEVFRNFAPQTANPQFKTPSANTPFSQSAQAFTSQGREFMDLPSRQVNTSTGYVSGSSPLPSANPITPPVGVDDILQELQSNTSNDVEDLLSETTSRQLKIKRKKHRRKKKNVMLNIE